MGRDLSWGKLAEEAAKEREKNFVARKETFPGQKRIEDLELEVFYLKETLREVIKENINLLCFFEKIGMSMRGKT